MSRVPVPKGDQSREAIGALSGYVYQVYQSALAWVELGEEEILHLEVAEDYAIAAADALMSVQVKETAHKVTINSKDIVSSIDSFVYLKMENPELQIRLRHLTTSTIAKEKSQDYRVGEKPTLHLWRELEKTGDLTPLREILNKCNLAKQTKDYFNSLGNEEFRDSFLKRIHFDCGALDSKFLALQLRRKASNLLRDRGGLDSQADSFLDSLLMGVLRKSIQKTERHLEINGLEKLLEKVTHTSLNRSELDIQNQLINAALGANNSQNTELVNSRFNELSSISEVPFPESLVNRSIEKSIRDSVVEHGVSWVFGASGVGKTLTCKIVAQDIKSSWTIVNLRSLGKEQVNAVISHAIDKINYRGIGGLLIDDLECRLEPPVIDKLLHLQVICKETGIRLLFTSPKPPSPDFLYSANLPQSIQHKVTDFSESDVHQILDGLGVNSETWGRYIYIASGGGHPQLVVAIIQNMQIKGWDVNEIINLNALLNENEAIEQVRSRSRERLLDELPEEERRLLERLSLKTGGFQRDFVLDMAQIVPKIPDGGIILDRLTGSWVDQLEKDRFSLSPLLTNLAAKTLTESQKQKIHFEIAYSLMNKGSISTFDANSALLAAWVGKNQEVIIYLCRAVFLADHSDLKMMAPDFMVFTHMEADNFAYKDDLLVNLMFRGAQLLLVCQQETSKERIIELLDRFEKESRYIEDEARKASIVVMVYAKLLCIETRFGALPRFTSLLATVSEALTGPDSAMPSEILKEMTLHDVNGISYVGFMFLFQAQQIKLISELVPLFKFLDSCGEEQRKILLKQYQERNMGIDLLLSGAWLSEHKEDTIDPGENIKVFTQLEEFAESWKHLELAVSCRRLRAVISDEYDNDCSTALQVLTEGIEKYAGFNSELIRAKARVHFRAEDHEASLELSKRLMEGDVQFADSDKAFLGREAAISAEKQKDYQTAREYYLYGSQAAQACDTPDMVAMKVGLMADAALASWHHGDREVCLRGFIAVLQNLREIDPKSSLRAIHCHATFHHALIWIEKDVTKQPKVLPDARGELIIYPGIISNPEPRSEIRKSKLHPVEWAWYKLAKIEIYSLLDIGISTGLDSFLPNGPVFAGQLELTRAKMEKSIILINSRLFMKSLNETIAQLAYANSDGGFSVSFDFEDLKYGEVPTPNLEQQENLSMVTEEFSLSFAAVCVFDENYEEFDKLLQHLKLSKATTVRNDFLDCLSDNNKAIDYNCTAALLIAIHKRCFDTEMLPAPKQIFELVFKALLLGSHSGQCLLIAKFAYKWFKLKWISIWEKQKFLLRTPHLHAKSISEILAVNTGSDLEKLVNLLVVTVPVIGVGNERQVKEFLIELRSKK